MRIQYGRLHLIANNVRMLLLGRRPNLGSRFLSLCERRIVGDWRSKYHHDILLLETFVDPSRFTGAVYRAANWLEAGASRGYRRRGEGYAGGSSPKLVLLRPLDPQGQEQADGASPGPRARPRSPENETVRMPSSPASTTSSPKSTTREARSAAATGWRRCWRCAPPPRCAAPAAGRRSTTGYRTCRQRCWPTSNAGRPAAEYERPSIYCIRNIMTKVDPEQLSKATAAYCRSIGWDRDSEAIAVDGKTMRGSAGDDGRRTHVLAACAHGKATPMAQKKPC